MPAVASRSSRPHLPESFDEGGALVTGLDRLTGGGGRRDDTEEDLLEVAAAADADDGQPSHDGRGHDLGPTTVGDDDESRGGVDAHLGDALGGLERVHAGPQDVVVDVLGQVEDRRVVTVDEVGHEAGGDDPSGVHDHDVGAGHLDLGEHVARHDDGAAGLRIPPQDRAHGRDLGRVSPLVGSSRMSRTSGSPSMACAMPSRWRMPWL